MNPYLRRKVIIDRMNELESSGKDCKGCSGTCCTYEANSMMVTPIEAVELVDYLRANNLFDNELKSRLLETVSKYRLDQAVGDGKRSFLRRTYTCPFFNHKELGCPLPREVKPFGCLAFNAHDVEKKAGELCFSEKEVLEKRDADFSDEMTLNEELKKKYSLYWDKTPLPIALLDFFKS
jgi:Fe-S-cluster containining protein